MRHPLDGAVAQLGERVVRNDEVRGSIPLSSTNGGIQSIDVKAIGLGAGEATPFQSRIAFPLSSSMMANGIPVTAS
jgi:hypothetical protein